MNERREASSQLGLKSISRPLGVARMAKEIRRQERSSDFIGYTVNYSVPSLREFFRDVGGAKWVLSRLPLSMIKCAQTRMTVRDLLDTADSISNRRRLSKQVRQLAREIRAGVVVPGIFLTRSDQRRGEHWIIEGYRRVLAHRIARASTILAYHPIDLFCTPEKREPRGGHAHLTFAVSRFSARSRS
jgi:hypothetical protein